MGLSHAWGISIRAIPLKSTSSLENISMKAIKTAIHCKIDPWTVNLRVSVPNTLHLNLDALDIKWITCAFFAHVCTKTDIQEQPYILPIVAITVSREKCKFRLNCLFDKESQRTYFCWQVIKILGCDTYFLTSVEFHVKTVLGSKKYIKPNRIG